RFSTLNSDKLNYFSCSTRRNSEQQADVQPRETRIAVRRPRSSEVISSNNRALFWRSRSPLAAKGPAAIVQGWGRSPREPVSHVIRGPKSLGQVRISFAAV